MPAPTAPHRSTVTLHLPARQPFDFGASLAFIGSFPAMTGQQDAEQAARTLTLALHENGTTLAARLIAAGSGPGLNCELTAERPIDSATADAAADRLSFYLGLDDDLAPLHAAARRDPAFQRIADRLRGYHQVKFPSPFELLCWAILCQRVPMPVARTMKQALVETVGNRIDLDGRELWAFPDAQQLAALSEAELASLIGNQRKAGFLHGSISRWLDLDEGFLRSGDYDEVRERVLALPGIGPWSASFLLIRGLGRMEHIAYDREAARAATRAYGHPVDEPEFRRLASGYGELQGYWAHYLRVGG
ncbi:DNA-3-methyladenine glycosylase 2 family protein [Streptacidiphilus sp. PB12-B1b]|uniref:DNA-3-methyladenine glycosylase family protein n=1 Tax=Streptacidiphilus sp. PB12-B1b TaxID=2705012 RepID=UPI0015FC1B93|nr:DNA-3-methyladenine glycosylase 2 family protein [Streptacidiphilus sp. PB12-B1b]QMU76329.1 DNA-3-methyladenine glycosylase 2 family protein [Streptacidiphilus sp. PB12-B1b]